MSVETINLNMSDYQRTNFKDRVPGYSSMSDLSKPMLGRVIVTEKLLRDGATPNKTVITLSDTHKGLPVPSGMIGEEKVIRDTGNLIVYRGRHMLLCRAFGKGLTWNDPGNTQPEFIDMEDKFITLFAVGSGGAASNNSQNPLQTQGSDYTLFAHGDCTGIGANSVIINNKSYHKFDDSYVRYVVDEEVANSALLSSQLEATNYNSRPRDTYLVAQIKTTFESSEANTPSGSQLLNEAGLFFSYSSSMVAANHSAYTNASLNPEMFAHVTFPSITKSEDRVISFNWLIYF